MDFVIFKVELFIKKHPSLRMGEMVRLFILFLEMGMGLLP